MGKIHAKNKKFADDADKEPFSLAGLSTLQKRGKIEKKRVTLEQLEQLALEHPLNTEEGKKELLSLIVEYNDVDKAIHKFLECKNCWVE